MTDSATISKLHERVSQHDVEFAEIRGVVKSISSAVTETKDAVKAIYITLDRINELIHSSQLKDEHLFAHMRDASEKFDQVNKHIDEKDAATNKRIDVIAGDRKTIAVSIILAFAIGLGGMVANFYFKEPDGIAIVAVEDGDD